MKKKITVRFVIERDYEVELTEGKENLGSWMCVGDIMVSSGHDAWGNTFKGKTIFDNPISDFRPFKGRHLYDANLYEITNECITQSGMHAWLFDDEEEKELWSGDEEQPNLDNVVQLHKGE